MTEMDKDLTVEKPDFRKREFEMSINGSHQDAHHNMKDFYYCAKCYCCRRRRRLILMTRLEK